MITDPGGFMRQNFWLCFFCGLLVFCGAFAMAQGHGHGNGKHGHDDDDRYAYSDHDRNTIRGWYHDQGDNLPPGLAKKDRLPPGLEKQLEKRGSLPPGLQKKMRPCPVELERRLPPPPPGYAHTVIEGHIVLLNRKTYAVLDVFHIEP